MSQQSDQWKQWQREKQHPERRGPVIADHSLNPLKSDLSSAEQQSQPHRNDDTKSDNDEHVPVEPQQESGIEKTEGATGTWLVVGQSTEQELIATIRQLENEKSELEKGKEELAKKKEELERENKALQEAKDKLEEKEKEVIDVKQNASFNKAILEKRLKDKNKELEAIKQQLERELAEVKEEVKLVKDRIEMTKIEELKKQLNDELEKERNDKVEQLQQKDIKIKHLEGQLSEKEKYIFDMEVSVAADQKERERLNKEKEEKEKESEKNIADAIQRIDELERQQQEHLQVIKNLTKENERLRVGGSDREKLTRELNEKDAELKEQHIKLTKLEEEMERIRIEEGEKRAELENKFRREQEDSKRETQRLINNQQEAAKAKYSGRIKEWQAKLKQVEEENKKLEEQLSEKEIERMSLSDNLTTKDGEILTLKEQLHNKEQKNAILKKSLDEKSQTAIDLEKDVGKIMKSSTEKDERIKELVERLQLKETENALFKQDFASERNDRERTHTQLTDLKEKFKVLEEELVKKEQTLADAQMKHHNLQQSCSTAEHDLEVSKKRVVKLLKKEAESSETIKSLTEEKRKMDKQLKEMKAMETDRMKVQEEEIQVLTAQVNAYSRECEKQKGLVAQNQERHKTEIQELNEKLTNEQKSKQQLESQLTTMKKQYDSLSANNESLQQSNQKLVNELTILRQQFDTLTASKESLLTAYNQEQAIVTSLQQQIERMRNANKVLMIKLRSSDAAHPSSHHHVLPKICIRPNNAVNSAPPTGSDHPTPVQQDGGNTEMVLSKGQQVAPPSHAKQPDSLPDDTPLMSKEEISRLFKWQDQQDDSGRVTVTQTPQQVEDPLVEEQKRQELAQNADKAVLEVERMRKQPLHRTTLPYASSKQEPVNQRQPKKKVKQQQAAADDSDTDIEENPLLENIDDEIHDMAEEVRRMSRRPDTQEVLFDDEDSPLPYDPNLVCPKCGRQYRVGEIQKLKRHMVELCPGKR